MAVSFPRTVSVLPVTADNTFILEKQYRSPVDAWVTELPAGKIDPGESPDTALQRELEEETGLHAKQYRNLFSGWVSCGYTDEYMYYYIADVIPVSDDERRHFPDRDEQIELIEVTPEDARAMIFDGRIIDAKTIILILAWFNLRHEFAAAHTE